MCDGWVGWGRNGYAWKIDLSLSKREERYRIRVGRASVEYARETCL